MRRIREGGVGADVRGQPQEDQRVIKASGQRAATRKKNHSNVEDMVAVIYRWCFVIKTYLGYLQWSNRSGVGTSM